jgi:hypothetical protein
LPALLAQVDWQDAGEVNKRLLSQALRAAGRDAGLELPASPIRGHYDAIQSLTDYDTVDEMVAAITAYEGTDDWLRAGAQKLLAGSPTSMRLIVAAQQRAKHLSLREAFEMEWIVSAQCCRHHDFAEGVRALLVDKDHQPRWSPASLAEVTPALVEEFFVSPASIQGGVYG